MFSQGSTFREGGAAANDITDEWAFTCMETFMSNYSAKFAIFLATFGE
jgi:hypothetical protein